MPCPICDHTLANLGLDAVGRRVFHCPRCGTVVRVLESADTAQDLTVPSLVTRLREAHSLTPTVKSYLIHESRPCAAVPWWSWRAICEAVGRPLPEN